MIRSRDTRPERIVRSGLWSLGFRFRIHDKKLPGRPDLVLPKWRSAIFVNGCFWHAHAGCRFFKLPRTRQEFWENKLERNRRRDAGAIAELRTQGWQVVTVWECALRRDSEKAVSSLADVIQNGNNSSCWEIREDLTGLDATAVALPCPDTSVE